MDIAITFISNSLRPLLLTVTEVDHYNKYRRLQDQQEQPHDQF